MAVLVHHQEDARVFRGRCYFLLHLRDVDIRAGHAQQRSVRAVNRQRAGHAHLPGTPVRLDIGEHQLSCLNRLGIPVAFRGVVCFIGAVLQDPLARDGIRHQGGALRQGEPDVVRPVRGAKRDHHIGHVRDHAQFVAHFRLVHALGEQRFHEKLPVLRRVRPDIRHPRNAVRILQQLLRVVAHHLYPDRHVPEHLVRELHFHVRKTVQVVLNHGIDDRGRGARHGGHLALGRIPGQL